VRYMLSQFLNINYLQTLPKPPPITRMIFSHFQQDESIGLLEGFNARGIKTVGGSTHLNWLLFLPVGHQLIFQKSGSHGQKG